MGRMTTFRSMMERVYDGGAIGLRHFLSPAVIVFTGLLLSALIPYKWVVTWRNSLTAVMSR